MLNTSASKTRLSQKSSPSPQRRKMLNGNAVPSPSANGVGDGSRPVSIQTQTLWLLAWLANNIGITILNKYAFSEAGFHYPLVTSAFHMLCNWLGTLVFFRLSGTEQQGVMRQQWPTLIIFSVIFSLNISMGNVSSSKVPVSFNQQVMRSLVPMIVMIVGTQMFAKTFSRARKLAVLPIMVGVMMACYGDAAKTVGVLGLVVTVLCVVLSGLKNVLSGEMLTGDMKMPPMQLLSRMAPLALLQMVFFACAFGEVADLMNSWDELKGGTVLYVVGITGLGSFSLNLCSLQANKVTSPLTLSIMANVKQVLVIAFSFVALNGEVATPINIVGIVIVVVASTRYSMLSVAERNRPPRAAEPVSSSGSVPLLPTTWTSERDAVERAT
ncbi:unnamed protein product [Pylaiella littoralis]